MVKKLTFLLILATIFVAFYGCRHGGQGGFIAKEAERQIISLTGTVGEDGSLASIVFPSGARIKADNAETFQSGVKVIVTEEKTRSTTPLNNDTPDDIYVYSVKAILYSGNPLVTPVEVTTLNKPFTITLPNNISDIGRCYLGTRENENEPWHYMRVTETGNILTNFVFIRASNEKAPKEVTLTLYRAGIQLALFVFNDSTETTTKAKVELTESTLPEKITTKEGKYTQDLEITSVLKGTGLESLKSSDLSIKVTFNSNIANITTFKADGTAKQLNCASNEGATGGKYAYSFDLKNIAFDSQIGSEVKLKYTLNTNNVNTTDFPKGFLVEFISVTNNDKLTPFYYSVYLTFETEEEQDEPEPVIEAYTITYNLDGGTVATANPTGYNTASETFVLNEPTKVGYTFIGWTGSNGDVPQKPLSIVQGSNSNLSFNANYSLINYEITYELDDGQTTADNPTTYDITSATITLNNPTRNGYTFIGWSGSNGNEPQTTVAIPQGSTGDKAYTANWSAVAYTIAYELNGGTLSVANPTGYNTASETFVLNEPTKEGYTFIGWTGSNGNTPQKPLSIVQGSTSDKTFTANYTLISYSITCNLDGGNLATDNPGSYDITSATITLNNPTKDYYTFKGWTGSNGEVPQTTLTIANGSTGDKTYTASYTPISYTITYDLADGALGEDVSNPTNYDITSATIAINNPTRDGYNFLGWEGTDIADGTASDSLTIPMGSHGARNYVASWTPLPDVFVFNLPNSVTLELRRCPAGTFTMGASNIEIGTFDRERPQHQVTISKDFWMGTYEVTQDQYFAIMGTNPSEFKEGAAASVRPSTSANYPVETVRYNDITTANTGFLAQINTQLASQLPSGYRFDLPTEAQWEYACRAGTVTALNNNKNLISASELDSNLSEVAWYWDNWGQSNHKTHTVGALASNTWGLYDMHGNVNELCKDGYDSGYYSTCGDCSDPVGPDTDYSRVFRGGCWLSSPDCCRSAFRMGGNPSGTSQGHGFRLALVKE